MPQTMIELDGMFPAITQEDHDMPTLAFLLDVDNTLLDNDHVKQIWDERLDAEAGPELAAHFWNIYEQVRREEDVVDIPLALTRFREETPLTTMDEMTGPLWRRPE